MNWSDLSMSQRSELMSIYLKNGITSLDEMKKHYNSFAEGGDTGKPPYKRYYATPQYGFSPETSDVATYNLEREVAKKSSANSMKDRKNASFVDYDRNKEENLKEQAREEEEELQARKDFATSMSLAGAAVGYRNPILGAMMQIPDAYMDWRYGRYPAAETSFNGLLETMSIADNSVIGDKVENVLFKVPKYGKFLGGGYHLFRRGNDYLIPVGVSNDASDLLTGKSMVEHIGSTLEDNDEVAVNMLRTNIAESNSSFAKGGKLDIPPYTQFLNTLPNNLKNSGNEYNMRRYWELNNYPKDFNEGIQLGMFTKQDDGYHANSVAFNPITNSYEFMKDRSHPTYNMELDWYYSDDPEAVEFRKKYKYTPGIGMIPDQYTPRK